MCSIVKKSIPDWHLYITQMETKWTKWYAMTLHVIAYRSSELLYGTHTFNFNCFFDDFNCVFTQIRCLSRLLVSVPSPSISSNISSPRLLLSYTLEPSISKTVYLTKAMYIYTCFYVSFIRSLCTVTICLIKHTISLTPALIYTRTINL